MRFLPLGIVLSLCFPGSYSGAAYQPVLIKEVPHVLQKPDFCGEACAEMYLRKLGKPLTQDQVFNLAGLDPSLGRGCYTRELNTALQRIGFKTGDVWSQVATAQAREQLEVQWQALYKDLQSGVPSIVCMHYSDQPNTTEHFRLVLGYDAEKDEVIYHEPAEANGAYRRIKKAKFLKLWPLQYEPQSATVIRLRLEADQIRDTRGEAAPGVAGVVTRFTEADFAQHILHLKENKLPEGFAVVVQPPFVVLGDVPANALRTHSTMTVKWAVDRLKKDFFKKDPDDILDIWLFKDETSYEKYTEEIFGDKPDTPYGYYSPAEKALIMNIATGGGTLVHEIVHPFMAANFPECPPWFNEGMGSLYEQCGEKNGHIYGHTNWRLPGLQKAIKADVVPSFKTLMAMNENEFYNEDTGTNYSQSRYLCYYLQEKGLLVKFYQEFTANKKNDPTGYKTLQKVLNVEDMDAFKKQWETFTLKLRFP